MIQNPNIEEGNKAQEQQPDASVIESMDIAPSTYSCAEDSERLLVDNEDIFEEISALNAFYSKNGRLRDVCTRDGEYSNCRFDFRLFPNELQKVCENHGGIYDETEHSIECQRSGRTTRRLQYRLDHYPSCFSLSCEDTDRKQLVLDIMYHKKLLYSNR